MATAGHLLSPLPQSQRYLLLKNQLSCLQMGSRSNVILNLCKLTGFIQAFNPFSVSVGYTDQQTSRLYRPVSVVSHLCSNSSCPCVANKLCVWVLTFER